jgi:hypothetical protein
VKTEKKSVVVEVDDKSVVVEVEDTTIVVVVEVSVADHRALVALVNNMVMVDAATKGKWYSIRKMSR